jgi:mannose-1-phosphate guanylyltransferase
LANRDFIGPGPVLVAHGDNLTDFDVAGLLRAHAARPLGCAITMLAFRTDMPETCGILQLDADHVVRSFHEKVPNPPGNLANGAVYIFEPEVLDLAASYRRAFVDLSTEVIPYFIGRILAVEHPGYHRDIGSPAALALANREYHNDTNLH